MRRQDRAFDNKNGDSDEEKRGKMKEKEETLKGAMRLENTD